MDLEKSGNDLLDIRFTIAFFHEFRVDAAFALHFQAHWVYPLPGMRYRSCHPLCFALPIQAIPSITLDGYSCSADHYFQNLSIIVPEIGKIKKLPQNINQYNYF